jgi:hypothetical protein
MVCCLTKNEAINHFSSGSAAERLLLFLVTNRRTLKEQFYGNRKIRPFTP